MAGIDYNTWQSGLDDTISGRDQLYANAGKKWGIDPLLLRAQVGRESSGKSDAVANARGVPHQGLTQMSPDMQRQYHVTDPTNDAQVIDATAHFLHDSLLQHGDMGQALSEWHGGPNTKMWGPKTQAYTQNVLGDYKALGGTGYGVVPNAPPNPNDAYQKWVSGLNVDVTPAQPPQRFAPASLPQSVSDEEARQDAMLRQSSLANKPQYPWDTVAETANAGMLGFGPELIAGRDALLHGQPYGQTLGNIQAQRAGYTAANPGLALGADVVGSLPATYGAMGLLGKGALALKSGIFADEAPMVVSKLASAPSGGSAFATVDMPSVAAKPAQAVWDFASGNAGRYGAGLVPAALRAGSQVTSGAIQGGTAGLLQSHINTDMDTGDQVKLGALGGGILGPVMGNTLDKWMAPFRGTVNENVGDLATQMRRLGVNIRGGQIAEQPEIRDLDRRLVPGEANTEQLKQYTGAVAKTIGLDDHEALTPEDLTKAREAVDAPFQAFAKGRNITKTPTFINTLNETRGMAAQSIDDEVAKRIHNLANIVDVQSGAGHLTGDEYLQLTGKEGAIGQAIRDPNAMVKGAGIKLRTMLDDQLMAQHPPLGPSAGEQDPVIAGLMDARQKWYDINRLEGPVDKAKATGGILNPTDVFNSASDSKSALGTLAKGAKLLPKPTPQATAKVPTSSETHGLNVNLTNLNNPIAKLTMAGLGLGAAGAAEHHIFPLMEQHPIYAAAAGGYAAAQMARNKLLGNVMQSGRYMNKLISNTPQALRAGVNPLLIGTNQPVQRTYGHRQNGQ